MLNYELTVVLPGKATAAKRKKAKETIGKLVKTLKGKVGKADDWGKKDLSYEIKKNNSGFFLHFVLELDGQEVKNLEQKLNLEEGIIRHLIVRAK